MRKLCISYYSRDWRGAVLSNLHRTPFLIDGIRMMCMESFVQSLHFPHGDLRHERCFDLDGPECKSMMYDAMESIRGDRFAHWMGERMAWGGPDHMELMRRGLRAKFDQCEIALEALMDTVGMEIVYDTPDIDRDFSYPPTMFVKDLADIRDSFGKGAENASDDISE